LCYVASALADIIVGGRRSNPQRNLRGLAVALVLLFMCGLVAYFIYQRVVSYSRPVVRGHRQPLIMIEGDASDPAPRVGVAGSSLSYSGTIAVLRTSGEPAALGVSHGRLLGDQLSEASAPLVSTITQAVSRGGFFGGLGFDMRVRWRYRFLDDGIPGHQLVELAAMLEGARRTAGSAPGYESFVRQQAALDVGVAAPWSSNAGFRAVARSLSFVTTLRGAGGDRLLVGRSFALPGAADDGDAATERLTLSFVKADQVLPFASIGWPGLAGVVSGINARGIAVMVHPVRTRDVELTRQAQPVPLLARDVLENADSLDEAIRIVQHASPLGAAAFLIVDGTARTWAVVERSPTQFAVHRSPAPAVVGDVLTSAAFAEDPENDRAVRVQPVSMRQRRMARLLQTRAEEPAAVVAMLRDHRDAADAPLPPGHRGAVHDLSAVHTALFDASAMVLWVADGPGAGARFRAFDLRYELGGEGVRAAPPADLPADPELDASVARRVRLARGALRDARRAQHRGDADRARELVQRALAYAPRLPEALKLAGDLARAAGDRDAASRYYERFLDAIPDDLGAEAEVRAILGR
jgi:isopenicillin-N N-acyltransferase like protein